jgi:hypothetical protein
VPCLLFDEGYNVTVKEKVNCPNDRIGYGYNEVSGCIDHRQALLTHRTRSISFKNKQDIRA